MTRHSMRAVVPAAAILLAVALSGCSAPASDPTAEPSAAPTSTPEPSTTPEPTSESPTVGATCEDVMTPDGYAKLEADGLEPVESAAVDPIATKIEDAGGLVCSWGRPQSDIALNLRQASIAGDGADWTEALETAGYTLTDDPVPGAWTGPVDPGSGISPAVVMTPSTITFVSSPAFAAWIRPEA